MYSLKIRKLLIFLLIIGWGLTGAFFVFKKHNGQSPKRKTSIETEIKAIDTGSLLNQAMILLQNRSDLKAEEMFEEILSYEPDNLDALWGKGEVLRRRRDFLKAGEIFKQILKQNPNHGSALTSLAYLEYNNDSFKEAIALTEKALKIQNISQQNKALAYLMLGAINSRLSQKGGFFSKIKYGTKIKGYFIRAYETDPSLSEVHVALGSFYLLAPAIAGGNLAKAIKELELAVEICPNFATANARLAQAYLIKVDLLKYNFYLERAKELDPGNEVVKELENNK
ncbi:MAG: tetratricopeptide repeat protein [Candidatus Omnitrophica bacterium]|nr:tetratricopeptide repeat protein [Candidatus Omnitrophota bacterium]